MAVEIYLEPELETMVQNDEQNIEWKKTCEELGMSGQLSMLRGEEKAGRPSPYLFMNEHLMKVFSTLCPCVVDYKKYNKSTIPLEVLGHIALSEKEQYFDKIKIWYDDVSPDPIVVGYIKGETDYNETRHLIARFGDEVLPMELLIEKSKNRFKEMAKTELKKYSNSIDSFVDDFFNGKNSSFGFSINTVGWNHQRIG